MSSHRLFGKRLPEDLFYSTSGGHVRLSDIEGLLVLYIHPGATPPGDSPPERWSDIPGAAGCTGQGCGYSNLVSRFEERGVKVFGVSSQPLDVQLRFKAGRGILHDLLSDPDLALAQDPLKLPTFDDAGITYYRRVTIVARDGIIISVNDDITDPADDAQEVLDYIGA